MILTATEIASNRGLSESTTGIAYSRAWLVSAEAPLMDDAAVLRSPGIPRIGDPYPGRAWLRCTSIDARIHDSTRTAWMITATYSSPDVPRNEADMVPDSTAVGDADRKSTISWGTQSSVESIDTDANGRLIVNINEEDYDPPLQASRSDLTLTITRIEDTFSARTAREYVDSVNADEFFGFPPNTVRCESISAEAQFSEADAGVASQSAAQWKVTYAFVIRFGVTDEYGEYVGWRARVAQRSRRKPALDENGSTMYDSVGHVIYEPIVDSEGNPITDPIGVDKNGQPIVSQSAWDMANKTVWKIYDIYPAKQFAGLRLP